MNINALTTISAAVMTLSLVSACAGEKPAPMLPTALVLADNSALNVDASSLEMRDESNTSHLYPHVGYRSSLASGAAAETWMHEHFVPTGGTGNSLRVTVQTDDITERLLPTDHGVSGWFKKQQGSEYRGELALRVAIVDPTGKVLSSADGSAFDTRTMQQDATDDDKKAAWADMTRKMFNSIDHEMLPRIRESMALYVH